MFFDGWHGVWRILLVGSAAYAVLIVWLRLTGKRTLTKWNAFDLVVTIALGSTLATVMLSKTTPLLNGAIALGLLVALQYAITWLAVRARIVDWLVKARPSLLLHQGRFLDEALRRQRVTRGEVRAAVRAAGIGTLEEVEAVVLETDGSVSVVRRLQAGNGSALEDVL